MSNINEQVIDFGTGHELGGVGGGQPDEGLYDYKLGTVSADADGDKVFLVVPWTVTKDIEDTGSAGRSRSDRQYFPHAGQDAEKRATTMEYLTRFLVANGLPQAKLKGGLKVGQIVASLNAKPRNGTLHYSPFVEGVFQNSKTTWLTADEAAAAKPGQYNRKRKTTPGYGTTAAQDLGSGLLDDDSALPAGAGAGAVDNLLDNGAGGATVGATNVGAAADLI